MVNSPLGSSRKYTLSAISTELLFPSHTMGCETAPTDSSKKNNTICILFIPLVFYLKRFFFVELGRHSQQCGPGDPPKPAVNAKGQVSGKAKDGHFKNMVSIHIRKVILPVCRSFGEG